MSKSSGFVTTATFSEAQSFLGLEGCKIRIIIPKRDINKKWIMPGYVVFKYRDGLHRKFVKVI